MFAARLRVFEIVPRRSARRTVSEKEGTVSSELKKRGKKDEGRGTYEVWSRTRPVVSKESRG